MTIEYEIDIINIIKGFFRTIYLHKITKNLILSLEREDRIYYSFQNYGGNAELTSARQLLAYELTALEEEHEKKEEKRSS